MCDGRRGFLAAAVLPWDAGAMEVGFSSARLLCFKRWLSRQKLPTLVARTCHHSRRRLRVTITPPPPPQALAGCRKWGFTQRFSMHIGRIEFGSPNLSDQGSILRLPGEGRQPWRQWWQVETPGERVRRVHCGVRGSPPGLRAGGGSPEPTAPPPASLLCWSAGNSSLMVG